MSACDSTVSPLQRLREIVRNCLEPQSPRWRAASELLNTQYAREGLYFGADSTARSPVFIPNQALVQHTLVMGDPVGVMSFTDQLAAQQIARGGGVFILHARIDDWRMRLYGDLLRQHQRPPLYVLCADAESSYFPPTHTCDLLEGGSATEKATQLLSVFPKDSLGKNQPETKALLLEALTTVLDALMATGKAFTLVDLVIVLGSVSAMEHLLTRVPQEHPAYTEFAQWLAPYQNKPDSTLAARSLLADFGGLQGRLSALAQGRPAQMLCSTTPDVRFTEIIDNNGAVYAGLPVMGKDSTGLAVGRCLVSGLVAAANAARLTPRMDKGKLPFLVILEEPAAYIDEGLEDILRRLTQAGIAVVMTQLAPPGLSDFCRDSLTGVGQIVTINPKEAHRPAIADWLSQQAPHQTAKVRTFLEASPPLTRHSPLSEGLVTSTMDARQITIPALDWVPPEESVPLYSPDRSTFTPSELDLSSQFREFLERDATPTPVR